MSKSVQLDTQRSALSTPALHRPRSIANEFSRYLVVGGVAFSVDFGSLYFLTEVTGLHYLASTALAFVIGLTVNYSLSRFWVFDCRNTDNSALEFALFAAIGLAGISLNELIMWIAAEKLHIYYLTAKVLSAAIVLIWNFAARRTLLFSGSSLPRIIARPAQYTGLSPCKPLGPPRESE